MSGATIFMAGDWSPDLDCLACFRASVPQDGPAMFHRSMFSWFCYGVSIFIANTVLNPFQPSSGSIASCQGCITNGTWLMVLCTFLVTLWPELLIFILLTSFPSVVGVCLFFAVPQMLVLHVFYEGKCVCVFVECRRNIRCFLVVVSEEEIKKRNRQTRIHNRENKTFVVEQT